MKRVRLLLEACLIRLTLLFFSALPPEKASAFGGWIGRRLGPHLPIARRARTHLHLCLPHENHDKIITEMWDNLGRTFAEYPHLETLARDYTEFIGDHRRFDGRKMVMIAGHIANWEIAAASFYVRGTTLDLIYRAPNNPWVNTLLQNMRGLHGKIPLHSKSTSGMRSVMEALRQGHNIGLLIDQKYNQGMVSEFFGQKAMTSPSFALLAQRYDCTLLPIRVERLQGCRFRVTVYPAFDTKKPVETIVSEANALLESWIRERPGQWLWLHHRWKATSRTDRTP